MPAEATQRIIGEFHPILVHFPIVLFTAALFTDVLNYFGKNKAFTAGHWFVIAGFLMCAPTIASGLAASAAFDPANPLLIEHRFLAFTTAISSSIYAGIRISAMIWQLPLKPSYYVALSILLVALVSWTSDYGGLLSHGVTPFSTAGF
jgi:uncharacterized membrane protein